MESDRVQARGVIMREAKNGEDAADAEGGWLDWLRDCGSARRSPASTRARSSATSATAARCAAGSSRRELGRGRGARAGRGRAVDGRRGLRPDGDARTSRSSSTATGPHVVGARHRDQAVSILRQFRERDCRLTLLPCTASADEVLARDPDLVFLANGPGDPGGARLRRRQRPRAGRQEAGGRASASATSCSAGRSGLETFKLPFGHRGANHPVKDLETGEIDITSQNHGFAVARPGRRPDDRRRRAGPLGDRLRRRRALPPQPLRPHGRGPGRCRTSPAARSSTTPRPARARTTPATCSTASWSWPQ